MNKNKTYRGDTSFFDTREIKVVAVIRYWHKDHKRKYTFEPYVNHLVAVATTIKQATNNSCMVAAALCHDLYEDTPCPQEDLLTALAEASFLPEEVQRINKWVWELTDEYTHDRYPEFNRKKRHELEADRRGKMSAKAQTIKYADMIDNLSDIKINDPKFYKLFSAEAALALEKMTKGDEELRNRALNLLNC